MTGGGSSFSRLLPIPMLREFFVAQRTSRGTFRNFRRLSLGILRWRDALFHCPSKSSLHMASLQKPGTESVLRRMPEVLDPSESTVVPRGIYFVPADAPKSVRFFDFATKQVRQIFQVDRDFEDSLSVSPDGHWILYTQTEEFNTDIMLVENLHYHELTYGSCRSHRTEAPSTRLVSSANRPSWDQYPGSKDV